MGEFEKVYDFQALYAAHKAARRGKRGNKEVIDFEMHLGENLTRISNALRDGTYKMSGYYSFKVHDPKERTIHALHYADRVVQHSLCDNVLMPILEKRLVYDCAACRIGKGTDFARERLTQFMRKHFKSYGTNGYFLKCDIRKYFDNIDHLILKTKLRRAFQEERILRLLDDIIDSYHTTPGKGIPLGNQTSQWFALYYLDGLDRLFKEKLGMKFYSRYMDDCIMVHPSKEILSDCLQKADVYLQNELQLSFNAKTQVIPIKNGVEYLGFRFHLAASGAVIRKVRHATVHRLRCALHRYHSETDYAHVSQGLKSYHAYLCKGHTYRLRCNTLGKFIYRKPA